MLIANHCDQSLLRNQLAFDLQRSLSGVAWQPNCTSVELYINGKYEGVYLLAEEIKVSKDRVNIAKDNVDDIDTGYLVQFTTYAGGDNGKECFNVQGASYEITSDLSENRQIRRNQVSYIENYIKKCFDALNKGNKEEAEKLMDLDSLVACYITEEVSKNIDSSWDSFYMYKDAGGKLVFGPVWDFDLAFGNDWRISDNFIQSYQDLYVACGDGSVNGDNRKTWYVIANNNAWFRQMVVDAWVKDYDNIKAVGERNITRATEGEAAFKRNFTRWQIFGQRLNQEPSYVRSLRSFESHAQLLNEWYVKRVEWLDDKFRNGDYVEKGTGTEKGSSGWNEYNDPNYENEGGEQFPSEHNNWSYETESSTALLEKYEDVSSLVLIDSIEAPKGFGGEGSANLFDNSAAKYCVNCGDGKYPVIFEMKEAVEVKAYVLYTANDTKFISARNPKSWTVYGSNDGKNWTEIAKENKGREALDATNFTGYGFEISSPGPYKYYYFYFINDETIQFSELTLLR